MDRDRLRFPKMNLAKAGVVSLAIFGGYPITEERLALLSDRVEGQGRGRERPRIVSAARYKPKGSISPYLITAISHLAEDMDEIHIAIRYREIPADTPRRKAAGIPEESFIEAMRALGLPSEVDCQVLFQLGDKPSNELWFPLPVNLAGPAAEQFFEVRGVRVAKLATNGDKPEYQFILDRPMPDQVLLQIDLPLRVETSITPDTLRMAFQRVQDIAGPLVGTS